MLFVNLRPVLGETQERAQKFNQSGSHERREMVRRVLQDPELIDKTENNLIWSARDADSEMYIDLQSKQKCE